MRGSLLLANHHSPTLQSGSTDEFVLLGGSCAFSVHPSQIPGRFVEFWGYYDGDQNATLRLRQSTTDGTDVTGTGIIEVAVTAGQGFFYGAAEFPITEQCLLVVTSQLAVTSPNCLLKHFVIQLSCEARPEDELPPFLYVSAAPSEHQYGRPNPAPYDAPFFNGPIVLTFDAPINPATVVMDYIQQNPTPLQSDFDPGSTLRIWIVAPGGPFVTPTIVVSGSTIEIHQTNTFTAPDNWDTPGGNIMVVRIYLTNGIKNTDGTALTPPVTLPAETTRYNWEDDED